MLLPYFLCRSLDLLHLIISQFQLLLHALVGEEAAAWSRKTAPAPRWLRKRRGRHESCQPGNRQHSPYRVHGLVSFTIEEMPLTTAQILFKRDEESVIN